MQSTKVVNQILLSSIAFGVSLGLGLLINRDFGRALLTGVITAPASFIGAIIADNRRLKQERLLRGSIQHQIEDLEEEEIQLYESLSAITVTRREIEASITALQAERNLLLERVSELHNQRNEHYKEFTDILNQKQQQEEEFNNLQTQLYQLEKKQSELNQSLAAKTAQLQPAEARLIRLQAELEQLQIQVTEQQIQQAQLIHDFATLEGRKQLLTSERYELEAQIKALEASQESLKQTLAPLLEQQQQVENQLTTKRAELKQLQNQVLEKQQQQQDIERDFANLVQQKEQLQLEIQYLQTQGQLARQTTSFPQEASRQLDQEIYPLLPNEWLQWLDFTNQLSSGEQQALKAILEQDEVGLKRVADENYTMPQVLIDSINEQASNFEDILFVGRGVSLIPEINEAYSQFFREPLLVYFKDLLVLEHRSESNKM
ncbi:MAG: hypothetical protein KME06_00490 [Kastovskya adunca ATA6-11-RM4]|jgi:chromosome segregation ATPase|nr:hypothetical protein [Kastovskya adunca ATA6-11-RM4]